MGLDVVVETEFGERVGEGVGDPQNLLHKLLPSYNDKGFHFLRYIDWYGNTVFNYLQVSDFLIEWEHLMQKAQTPGERELCEKIEALARRVESERLYLRFIGD